jgi:hypothetical protein
MARFGTRVLRGLVARGPGPRRAAAIAAAGLALVTFFGPGLLLSLSAMGEEREKKLDAQALIPSAEKPSDSGPPVYKFSEGKAQVKMFGLVGEGYKFVYVLDRSGSMGGAGNLALRAVKQELARSLQTLDSVHQFQIIFYNERPVLFNPTGIAGKLAFATEQTKRRAIGFIETITAEGGTHHVDALKMAIRLRPDVIFWLTDGDEPRLTDAEIEAVSDKAAGITIHAIEFGTGPQPEAKSFLAKVAAKNGGKFAYVDLAKRASKEQRAR